MAVLTPEQQAEMKEAMGKKKSEAVKKTAE